MTNHRNIVSKLHVFALCGQLLRWMTSQVLALWRHSAIKTPGTDRIAGAPGAQECVMPPVQYAEGEHSHNWRPWEHIYAINKVGKGPNIPVYNPHGKYVVKLYWMVRTRVTRCCCVWRLYVLVCE